MYNYTLKLSICKGFFEKKHIFYVLYKIDKTKHTIILKTNKRNFSKMHRPHKARKHRLPDAFGFGLSILHYFSKAPKEGSRKTVSFCHSPLLFVFLSVTKANSKRFRKRNKLAVYINRSEIAVHIVARNNLRKRYGSKHIFF